MSASATVTWSRRRSAEKTTRSAFTFSLRRRNSASTSLSDTVTQSVSADRSLSTMSAWRRFSSNSALLSGGFCDPRIWV